MDEPLTSVRATTFVPLARRMANFTICPAFFFMRPTSSISRAYFPACLANSLALEYTRSELAAWVDWADWVPRLIAYARWRQSRYSATLRARCELQPADCAQEAVKLWLDGIRQFESGTEAAFFEFLCSVIDSLINHDVEKIFRRGTQVQIRQGRADDQAGGIDEAQLRSNDDFERKFVFEQEAKRFFASLEPDLATYAIFRLDELDFSAEERAAALGVSVADVRNFDRRLKRWGMRWKEVSWTVTSRSKMPSSKPIRKT